MSMVAGALWALIPALLYAYKKVNVIILTIMMNYIGLYLANRLIVLNIFDSAKNQTRAVPMAHKLPTLGFDKIYIMQNSMNIDVSEVLATYIYKQGIISFRYSYSTAIGLFNNAVNFILLTVVNKLSGWLSGSSLW